VAAYWVRRQLTLAFGTSWLRVIEWLGAGIVNGIDRIRGGVASVGDSHSERVKIKEARRARAAHLQSEMEELEAYDQHIVDAPPKNPLAVALENARSRNSKLAEPDDDEGFDRFDKDISSASELPVGNLDAVAAGQINISAEASEGVLRTGIASPEGPTFKTAARKSANKSVLGKLVGFFSLGAKQRPEVRDALLDGLGASGHDAYANSLTQRTKAVIEGQRSSDEQSSHSANTQSSEVAAGSNDPVAVAQAHAAAAQAAADAAATAARTLSDASGPAVKSSSVTAPTADPANSDRATRKKKIAIKERVPAAAETRVPKIMLDLGDSELPPITLLDAPKPQSKGFTETELETLSRLLEEKLAEFRILVEVVAVQPYRKI